MSELQEPLWQFHHFPSIEIHRNTGESWPFPSTQQKTLLQSTTNKSPTEKSFLAELFSSSVAIYHAQQTPEVWKCLHFCQGLAIKITVFPQSKPRAGRAEHSQPEQPGTQPFFKTSTTLLAHKSFYFDCNAVDQRAGWKGLADLPALGGQEPRPLPAGWLKPCVVSPTLDHNKNQQKHFLKAEIARSGNSANPREAQIGNILFCWVKNLRQAEQNWFLQLMSTSVKSFSSTQSSSETTVLLLTGVYVAKTRHFCWGAGK